MKLNRFYKFANNKILIFKETRCRYFLVKIGDRMKTQMDVEEDQEMSLSIIVQAIHTLSKLNLLKLN
jgi:hypothetical protein